MMAPFDISDMWGGGFNVFEYFHYSFFDIFSFSFFISIVALFLSSFLSLKPLFLLLFFKWLPRRLLRSFLLHLGPELKGPTAT
jgi:hypothetical protein